jgi:hypothetical protein
LAFAAEVSISPASVFPILINNLGKWGVCAKWIPHMLSDDQRAMHVLLVMSHLQCWKNEGSVLLSCFAMIDESWVHSFVAQLK